MKCLEDKDLYTNFAARKDTDLSRIDSIGIVIK
ncbi:hypothetical protein HMPREF9138_00651 [Prevotella histicola F0411]|uniref:Uncharacterized protein n=1 Tax=Prevotella histicola F0411 TaxID=857291 RepID=G6AEX4_9BACT|nr:hypothetical protein HMPREF9138_00651 [Prevotella histicola F0411]